MPATDPRIRAVASRVIEQAERCKELRDVHGWPEPKTIADLRSDPRVQLRNTNPDRPEAENPELAAALMLLVCSDREVLRERQAECASKVPASEPPLNVVVYLVGNLIAESVARHAEDAEARR